MEIQQILLTIQSFANSNFGSGCAGAFITILFSWIIIPYFKKKNDIESFIQYFYSKNNLNNHNKTKQTIYDVIQTYYILQQSNYSFLITEIYNNGLKPSEVVHYINDKSTVPLRISKNGSIIKFPFNNDILCILFKARKQIKWSIIIIGMIVICKFII